MINIIIRHISNQAAIMKPLTIADSILWMYPNTNKPFGLYHDASQLYALGAVLTKNQETTTKNQSWFFTHKNLQTPSWSTQMVSRNSLQSLMVAIIFTTSSMDVNSPFTLIIWITCANTKHTNLRMLWQWIEFDDAYSAKIEHITGVNNTGTDSLSCLKILEVFLQKLRDKVFTIHNLDHDENKDFLYHFSHQI